jgi:CTP synthase
VERRQSAKEEVRIGIVGKYFKTGDFVLSDVYISVIEALKHAAAAASRRLKIDWLDAEDFEAGGKKMAELARYHGLLVPGGFGGRGVEGKIKVIQYAREHKIPYFGLCYGMQLAVIEFSRHLLGLSKANTTEVDADTPDPVIDVMPDQKDKIKENNYGGSMRLGAYPAKLAAGSLASKAYGAEEISERHRHRYEVNPEYIERITAEGGVFSGRSPDGVLMEIFELPPERHPFFVGTQFHPEFKSSPLHPHPLFSAFVTAATARAASARGRSSRTKVAVSAR